MEYTFGSSLPLDTDSPAYVKIDREGIIDLEWTIFIGKNRKMEMQRQFKL